MNQNTKDWHGIKESMESKPNNWEEEFKNWWLAIHQVAPIGITCKEIIVKIRELLQAQKEDIIKKLQDLKDKTTAGPENNDYEAAKTMWQGITDILNDLK